MSKKKKINRELLVDNLRSIKVILAKSVIDGVSKMRFMKTIDDAIKELEK